MQCQEKCLLFLFEYLSKFGLREKMVSGFVLDPPIVSYTLRLMIHQEAIEQEQLIGSIFNNASETHDSFDQNSTLNPQRHSVNEHEFRQKQTPKKIQIKISQPEVKQDQTGLDIPLCATNYMYPVPLTPEILLSSRRDKSKSQDEGNIFKRKLSLFHKQYKTQRFASKVLSQLSNQIRSPQQLHIRRQSKIMPKYYYTPHSNKLYPPYQFLLIDQDLSTVQVEPQENLSLTSYILTTNRANQIASLFVEIQDQKNEYVLLYSHGNSADIGHMLDTYLDLAINLNINVFGYEYSGYGQSTGVCSDINVLYDIHCAYSFLVKELGFSPNKIILYGYSIGSGPSVTLASSPNIIVGGLIIHSGLSSAIRVINPNDHETLYNDIFPNCELIQNIQCPVYILHGLNDRQIPVLHAQILAKKCNRLHTLWLVVDASHTNIDTKEESRIHYLQRLKIFIQDVIDDNTRLNEEQLANLNRAKIVKQFNHCYNDLNDFWCE